MWSKGLLPLLACAIAVMVVVGAVGATAAQALLGPTFRVTQERGRVLETDVARWTFATVHPAAVLRAPDDELRRLAKDEFIADFELVGDYFRKLA